MIFKVVVGVLNRWWWWWCGVSRWEEAIHANVCFPLENVYIRRGMERGEKLTSLMNDPIAAFAISLSLHDLICTNSLRLGTSTQSS
jgi:hypothetical protein